jgi:murein DD-endopeptidase MepM/ murein hydrolase activator NlpD
LKKILLAVFIIVLAIGIYFSLGSQVTENLDDYVYDLPYARGSSHLVVQGYGGRFSHKNKAALDFKMAVGTPVYAAREGVVLSYRDDSDEGGPLPYYERKANYIIIQHDDGSFGCYWHLRLNGVVAKEGKVGKGQLIGYSGATGFVLWPHLHFTVKKRLNYDMNSYVRTRFRTRSGVQLLERGKSYEKP